MRILDEIRGEWSRNARLRLGVLVIFALVAFYEIDGMGLITSQLKMDYSGKLTELSRIQAVSKERDWDSRAAKVKLLKDALQAEIPAVDTVGLGQATFQGMLGKMSTSAGGGLSVTMDTPSKVAADGDYWKFPAQLSGPLSGRAALELIRQIESQKDLVMVQASRITGGDNPYVTLSVVAIYRVKASKDSNASP